MTNEEMNNMVQSIYDRIFDSVTKAEPGGKPLLQSATTLLSLCKPGMAINPKDYKNPWTPGNINGSQLSALNTAMLVDVAPKLNSLYTDSGNTVSQTYGQIMSSVNVKAQPPNPAIDQQLKDANSVLYRTINVTDPDTGEVTVKTIESQLYRDYQDNQSAYMAARAAYIAAYLDAQKSQSGKSTWPLLAPTLQLPVKSAYDKWRSNFADKIEQALAIMNTTSANALSKAFDQAKKLFEGYGAILDESGSGMGPLTYRSYLLPSDWYSPTSSSKWTVVDISSGSVSTSSKSDFTSYGGSAGFNMGLWSVGGSAGHSSQNQHMNNETSGLRISFEYTVVNIRRPWITFNLLGIPGWDLSNLYAKGKISNGTKDGQDNSLMPALPTSFVVVRNIIISAKWAKSDWDLAKSQTSGGGSIGWGPFKIGGSYSSSNSKETFTSSFADGKITVPGVQIIGWISQLVPYCPPA